MITNDATIPGPARPYQGRPAGLVSRSLASGMDLVIVATVLVVLYAGWSAVRFLLRPAKFEFPEPSLLLVLVAGFAVLTLYLTLGWTMTGRTYGDHLMGLRVVDRAGNTLHLYRASLRAVLCALFPIGLAWTAFSAGNRSLQDILVRTTVTYDWHLGPRREVRNP
ncbi:MAG TPA: RDD family protein [Microlunatus sp.]